MVLGVEGLRGPRALVFLGIIYSMLRKAKVTCQHFLLFLFSFLPLSLFLAQMAANQVEVCGQEAGREPVSAGGRLRCNCLNLRKTRSHSLSSSWGLKIPVKKAVVENLVIAQYFKYTYEHSS